MSICVVALFCFVFLKQFNSKPAEFDGKTSYLKRVLDMSSGTSFRSGG